MDFFAKRNQSYKFMCLAPTGAAAALIKGSTYHSILGILKNKSKGSTESIAAMSQVRNRLMHVKYIFIDEVSMVDCVALYDICARMCTALGNDGTPFGGINIICAGDFAQLPPAVGTSLYSHTVGRVIHKTQSIEAQQASIGKAIWHQFTTVVILRENMRQKSQTPEDAKLRTCLENLRYRACTPGDISLLQSRVAGKGEGRPSLNDANFRNVSIITRFNATRDKINMEASKRFAQESGQKLVDFYSIDMLGRDTSEEAPKRMRKHMVNPLRKTNIVNQELQELLWNTDPAMSEHHAGKLSLCIGMPIMLKQNEATECSITNGAEGRVVGWTAVDLPYDKQALDTLFVELTAAPEPVQIPGLPPNVVPIPTTSKEIKCVLPSGATLTVTRKQVCVLPNFAMTEFASQGRTRPHNVCNIQDSPNHQAIYTALSRGSTLKGTVISQPFDSSKLVGGISGSLRQEFRELELLDDITKMRWEGNSHPSVTGVTRSELIHNFRKWKGEEYIPKHVHQSLSWASSSQYPNEAPKRDTHWRIVCDPKSDIRPLKTAPVDEYPGDGQPPDNGVVTARGTQVLPHISNYDSKKRKNNADTSQKPSNKKAKTSGMSGMQNEAEPVCPFKGFPWDSVNHSCAYDSLLTVLLSVYTECRDAWTFSASAVSQNLCMIGDAFNSVAAGQMTLVQARNHIRQILGALEPEIKAMGTAGACCFTLAEWALLPTVRRLEVEYFCPNCGYTSAWIPFRVSSPVEARRKESQWALTENLKKAHPKYKSVRRRLKMSECAELCRELPSSKHCPTCCNNVFQRYSYKGNGPPFVYFGMDDLNPTVETEVRFSDEAALYRLCGVIYYASNHFVCRIVDKSGNIWFHDGYKMGSTVKYVKNSTTMSNNGWLKTGNYKASGLIYTKIY